ncbi:MAG: hypothetical protein KF767_11595 [Bdellovibrionaceae bacterium]|nr:hypothetical protein [Pseudobdellovibrionaceae bacterium]
MKSLVVAAALTLIPLFASALPECTSANEGQTLLLEDGQGPAQVYVCTEGAWVPASTLPKAN